MFNEFTEKRKSYMFEQNEKLDARTYNILIGLCLLYGFVINALMVNYLTPVFLKINIILLIVGYFVLCFVGIALTNSRNPITSFLGYNFIVVPVGVVLSVALAEYNSDIIFKAFVATSMIVGVMTLLAIVMPKIFLSLGKTLFISLLCCIVVELFMLFFLGMSPTWMDWLVVLIFSAYIGYDWQKANEYPKTLDNAIDSSVDLYLDIINIFIRLLSIFGKSDD